MPLSKTPYNPKSGILLLALDCFRKKQGGSHEYDFSSSVYSELPDYSGIIQDTRGQIFSRLKRHKIRWEGANPELPINEFVSYGKDFGGEDISARYLPAIERYTGDFYAGLGNNGKEKLLRSNHHFLIVSACYGILKPKEPIQYYACQFGNRNEAYFEWVNKGDKITEMLSRYIKKHKIKRIFTFLQCDVPAYYQAVKWQKLENEFPELTILHGYSWATGDRPLHFFGEYVAENMLDATEKEMLKIEPNSNYGNITFYDAVQELETSCLPEIDPIEFIKNGDECATVEFKQSAFGGTTKEALRCLTTNHEAIFKRVNSCWQIAKAICAFLNSDGGNLLIGVKQKENQEDENIPIGIESEFPKVAAAGYSGSTEGYGRLIEHAIIRVFFPDLPYYKDYITIDFFPYDGNTICWIKVKPAPRPTFVQNYESKPSGDPWFIVRNNFESRGIPDLKDAVDYTYEHFCKGRPVRTRR